MGFTKPHAASQAKISNSGIENEKLKVSAEEMKKELARTGYFNLIIDLWPELSLQNESVTLRDVTHPAISLFEMRAAVRSS